MEPVDDILLPREQPKRQPRRLTSKHILRVLAVILMAAALAYLGKVLKLDSERLVSHSRDDLQAVAPIFLFGALLWWYAGRSGELTRPLFRSPGDPATEPRVDWCNFFLLGASLVCGVLGLGTVIVGLTFLRYGTDLRKAMPVFFAQLEKSLPFASKLEANPMPVVLSGVVLVVVAVAAYLLAARRRPQAA
jgi:hypothetical protein